MKPKLVIRFLLSILIPVTLFHISVLLKIVPQDIIWGGRLGSDSEMYMLEGISIIISIYLTVVLMIKGSFIRPFLSPKVVNFSLWVFLVLFILNTVGNVFAKSATEQLFGLLTMVMSVLLWTVLKKQDTQKSS
jgi:hypothetical protein